MPELIDRQAVRLLESDADAYTENWNDDYEKGFCDAINKVLKLPTIEAEPVRRGRWIRTRAQNVYGGKQVECSECGFKVMLSPEHFENITEYERFCCHCGARMDGGAGMTGPRDLEPACWVPEQEDEVTESAAGKHIECDPRRGWHWAEDLTPSTEELLEGVRLHETPAREMMNPPEFTFEIADDGSTIYKRIAEVFDRSAAAELVRSEIELAKKRAPIIAVDFDGTLCENAWPGIGKTKWETVQALIAAQAAGARLILWTNRVGARLAEAIEWCRQRELEFDAVNENLPEVLAAFVTDTRKVYADIYLDDRAAQPSAAVLGQLWETARETMNEAAAEKKEKEQE